MNIALTIVLFYAFILKSMENSLSSVATRKGADSRPMIRKKYPDGRLPPRTKRALFMSNHVMEINFDF